MGLYINQNSKGEKLSAKGKLNELLDDGAKITDATFKDDLVCISDNGMFDAAAYMYSKKEFDYVISEKNGRKRTFVTYPYAKELAK